MIEPKEHFAYVDDFLAEHGSDALVFVATDSAKFLEKMQRRYGDRIRHYEVGVGPGWNNRINHRQTPTDLPPNVYKRPVRLAFAYS